MLDCIQEEVEGAVVEEREVEEEEEEDVTKQSHPPS
jgi:hypothetical protein